jgi:ABC-type spermidine/putrescine transport system permease subunit I
MSDAHIPDAKRLDTDKRLGDVRLFGLTIPGLAIVACLLVVPVGWLFTLSFVDGDGSFTVANFTRIWTEGAYVDIFIATFEISALVTVICVLLGYPLAFCLSQLPQRWSGILLLGVLIPFWTSILVRTYAWLVILQRKGIVNNLLIHLGVIHTPLSLVNNMTGTVIGMVHVMMPFLVLPLYASMRTIDVGYMRAAANLGASPTRAFWQIFFPLSMPGLVAGLILTFILCLGFYITPAVLGGGKVQMIAQRVAASVSLYPTWGPAAALGVVLLVLTAGFLLLSRLVITRLQSRFG